MGHPSRAGHTWPSTVRLADLVLLDANPLEEIGNTKRIAAVVVNGRFLSRAELDRMLDRAAKIVKQ